MNIIYTPLLLLIVIVIALMIITPKIRFFRLSWRGSMTAAGIYLGVLIILVPILYLLPQESPLKTVADRSQAETLAQNTVNSLYNGNLPTKGDSNNLPGLYKNGNQTFKVDVKKLYFNVPSNLSFHPIFVARKNVDDKTIEISTYAYNQFAGDIEYTKFILPPIITFANGTLTFQANHQALNFSQFDEDFTVKQFKKNLTDKNPLSTTFGDQIVYMRIPKSLEVAKEMNGVHMLNTGLEQ